MSKIKIAYLPFYIKLYDDSNVSREPMYSYMKTLISMIESQGFEVVLPDASLCRIKEEFDAAAAKFNADPEIVAVVTQHIAYSPALESIEALKSLKTPIIVFDTTPDYKVVSVANYYDAIDPNHGIHGVQDMCNLLNRNHVPFQMVAGHAFHSDVVAELCGKLRAAAAAKFFKSEKVGMVGKHFEGMGDFLISDERYKADIGCDVVSFNKELCEKYMAKVTDEEIAAEIESDYDNYDVKIKNRGDYEVETRTGLAVRKWMEDEKLDAVTINFLHCDEDGLPAMPFVECGKILGRGTGYAGEGDTLTAGLVGALLKFYPDTTFTEMFNPDWEQNKILMNHMGEINPRLTKWPARIVGRKWGYNSCQDTAAMIGCYRAGSAVLVNLAPLDEGYNLILTRVEMTDDGLLDGAYAHSVQGWMKPPMNLPEYLKAYSKVGGTHHSALVYNGDIAELASFGEFMGFNTIIIK